MTLLLCVLLSAVGGGRAGAFELSAYVNPAEPVPTGLRDHIALFSRLYWPAYEIVAKPNSDEGALIRPVAKVHHSWNGFLGQAATRGVQVVSVAYNPERLETSDIDQGGVSHVFRNQAWMDWTRKTLVFYARRDRVPALAVNLRSTFGDLSPAAGAWFTALASDLRAVGIQADAILIPHCQDCAIGSRLKDIQPDDAMARSADRMVEIFGYMTLPAMGIPFIPKNAGGPGGAQTNPLLDGSLDEECARLHPSRLEYFVKVGGSFTEGDSRGGMTSRWIGWDDWNSDDLRNNAYSALANEQKVVINAKGTCVYDDADSCQRQLDRIKRHGLKAACVVGLGLEDPKTWDVLADAKKEP